MTAIEYRVTNDRRQEWARCLPEWERNATRERYIDQSARTLAGGGAAALTEVDGGGRLDYSASDVKQNFRGGA